VMAACSWQRSMHFYRQASGSALRRSQSRMQTQLSTFGLQRCLAKASGGDHWTVLRWCRYSGLCTACRLAARY
jgi:hypothetical protein